jgi:GT2 family glycosyltransferase
VAFASPTTREVFEEVGPFDERFNPAYVEDTDYWHRAWELGVELTPVPAARVTHARRTSADKRSDWLLTAHRYMYGWKHGVEPMRAPPYYKREIVEYEGAGRGGGEEDGR